MSGNMALVNKSIWLFVLCLSMLSVLSILSIPFAYSLPEFEIDTTLEDDEFYTMPLLSESILRYNYTSTLDGNIYDTNVTADIITGEATSHWENKDFDFRKVFSLGNIEKHPKTSYLYIDTEEMISSSELKSDCSDMSLYDTEGTRIPFVISGCGSNRTILKFILHNESGILNLYYSGPDSTQDTQEPYRFYEDYSNSTDYNNTWDTSGNITLDEGHLHADSDNITTSNLSSPSLSSGSELSYRFFASGDSSYNISLSESGNLSERSYTIFFRPDKDNIEACWIVKGNKDCSRYSVDFAEQWNDLHIDISDDGLWLYLNDQKLNSRKQYYNIDEANFFMATNGLIFFDHLSIMEKGDTSFTAERTEEHLHRIEGQAFQGDFGFLYNIDNLDSGLYTVATKGTRPELDPQYSFNTFEAFYNRIIFSTKEEGYVNELQGNYLLDTSGTLTIENPNDEEVSLSFGLDTTIMIIEDDGDSLENGRLNVDIGPFSQVEIDYNTTGVTNYPPVDVNEGALITVLKDLLEDDVHELGSNRFSRKELELFDAPDSPEAEEEELDRKELRFSVEDDFFFDSFTRVGLTKFFSQSRIRPGDVVEVMLRVTNFDPIVREIQLNDSIPREFVLVDDPDKRDLVWDFKMNRHTSRLFTYEIRYTGKSTGPVDVPKANLTSERLLMFSNDAMLLRDNPNPNDFRVSKSYHNLRETSYDIDYPVKVRISVTNLGSEPVREIILEDSPDVDFDFEFSSVRTPYRGRWVIDELSPGETWTVDYLTNNGSHVKNSPSLDSYVDDIDYSSDVYEKKKNSVSIDIGSSGIFSFTFFLILLAVSNMFIILYYVYKNPFFEVEEKLTPKTFALALYEQIPLIYRNTMEKYARKLHILVGKIRDLSYSMIEKLRVWSSSFKRKAEKYYHERNMSLVQERSSSAMHRGVAKINDELNSLRKMTLKDWISLFIKYKREFLRAIKNKITYSMFSLSHSMLEKNENSKIGQILNFSSKVLNPELKNYLSELADKKLKKKQDKYNREIQNIDNLLKRNSDIRKGNSSLKYRISAKFLRLKQFLSFWKK